MVTSNIHNVLTSCVNAGVLAGASTLVFKTWRKGGVEPLITDSLSRAAYNIAEKAPENIMAGMAKGFRRYLGPSLLPFTALSVGSVGATGVLYRYLTEPFQTAIRSKAAKKLADERFKRLRSLNRQVGLTSVAVLGAGALALSAHSTSKSWNAARAKVWTEEQKIRQLFQDAIEPIDISMLTTRLKDVHGQSRAKEEIEDILKRLANPGSFKPLLAADETLVQPVLFHGPPGVGKTILSKALAGELHHRNIDTGYLQLHCDKLTFRDSGPRTFSEIKRQIAESPHKNIVIFMDEFDSLGSRDDQSLSSSKKDTINAMLKAMEGISSTEKNVLWIGATNHLQKLDSAVLRRFPVQVEFELPQKAELKSSYSRLIRDLKLAPPTDLNIDELAEKSAGFAYSDIKTALLNLKRQRLRHLPVHPDRTLVPFTRRQLLKAIQEANIARQTRLGETLSSTVPEAKNPFTSPPP